MSTQTIKIDKKAVLVIAVILAAYLGEPKEATPPQKVMILKEIKHNAK